MATPPRDDRASAYFSPDSSNRSYFKHEAIRSGYRDPVDSRESEFQRYPVDLRDPVEREKEKDRIRAEIMAEQAERRRILEDEIRMELMLERQVALKRWELSRMPIDHPHQAPPLLHDPIRVRPDAPPENRPYVHDSSMMLSDASGSRQFVDEHSRFAPSETRQFVDERSRIMHRDAPSIIHHVAHEHSRLHSPSEIRYFVHEPPRIPQPSSYLEERRMLLTMLPSHQVAGDRTFASLGYQHHPMLPSTSNLVLLDPKPNHNESRRNGVLGSYPYQHYQMPPAASSMARKEKNLLVNRDDYISGLVKKRKSSALGSDHHRGTHQEKKSKGVWRCDLCKVITSSERGLNDHLKGKRHKSMEEEKSNPVTKESTLNTNVKTTETSRAIATTVNEKQTRIKDETLHSKATMLDKNQKSKMNEAVVVAKKKKNSVKDEPPCSKATMVDKKQNNMKGSDGNGPNKFKFWCGICKVGVTSQKTLFDHEKGRRHMENLKEEAKLKT